MNAAEITAVLVRTGIEAQVVFPRPAVSAEGTGDLDLQTLERPGVEDQPAPPGRFHDGNLFIDQAMLPSSYGNERYAALCPAVETAFMG